MNHVGRFRSKQVLVEAVPLRWDTWSEVCEFMAVGRFEEGLPEGCYVDASGDITDDCNGRIGLKIPGGGGGYALAVQDDWLVRSADGSFGVFNPTVFAANFEPVPHESEYSVEFKPDWSRYPKLAGVFERRPPVNVYWEELGALLAEARSDAVRFVHDVRVDELLRARHDERERIAAASRRPPASATGATSVRDLTDAQLLRALKNVGCDLSCDACAEVFFTGSRTHDHACPKGR